MAKMPWFPLYAADFMTDTATWSDEEIGAYFRLLCHQWINGALPVQHERLARLVSASPERLADLWLVIGPKFHDLGDGRLQNARLERERRAQATRSQARTERARKAAAARWGDDDGNQDTDSCSAQSGEQCSSIACQSQSQSQSQKQKSQSPPDEQMPSPEGEGASASPNAAPCPHQDIISIYHEVLPELVPVKVWDPRRQSYLRSRWRESPERQSVEWWRGYFLGVRESDFLMGRTNGSSDRGPFRCSLEWLVRPSNFAKVLEGMYSGGRPKRGAFGNPDCDPESEFS